MDVLFVGQSSAPNAESVGETAEPLAEIGRMIVEDGLSSVTAGNGSMASEENSKNYIPQVNLPSAKRNKCAVSSYVFTGLLC